MFTLIGAALVLAVVNSLDWNRLIRRALELAHYEIKDACAEMVIDRAQFDRQLKGDGHVSLTRLGRLRPDVLRWVAILLNRELGLPEECHAARHLHEAAASFDERWRA